MIRSFIAFLLPPCLLPLAIARAIAAPVPALPSIRISTPISTPNLAAKTATKTTELRLAQQEAVPLELGRPVERAIAAEEEHRYVLSLEGDRFASVTVTPENADVALLLYDSAGHLVYQSNFTSAGGVEALSTLLVAGEYHLGVYAVAASADARYAIELEDLRVPTEREQRQVEANRLFGQAYHLWAEQTAASLRAAIATFERAADIYRELGETNSEAAILNYIGASYDSLSEFQQAIAYYEPALELTRKLGNWREEATLLSNLGRVYFRLGNIEKALELYELAVPIAAETGYQQLSVVLQNNIGQAYTAIGENQKALEFFDRALTAARETDNFASEANALTNIGVVYDAIGEKQKALEYYNRALPIRREIGDVSGEATTLANIGVVYYSLGEWQQALDRFEQTLVLRRKIGDRAGEATDLNNIAQVYSDVADVERALEYQNRALEILEEIGDRAGQAVALTNVGILYEARSQTDLALEYFERALPLRREVGDKRGEASTLISIGYLYFQQARKLEAVKYYQQALVLQRATDDRAGTAITLNNLAIAYDALDDREAAFENLQQALSILQMLGDRSSLATTRYNIAKLKASEGALQEAKENVEIALELVEDLRTNVESKDLRATYFATVQEFYDLYIHLLMSLHWQDPTGSYDAQALYASERSRARNLLDLLAEANADVRKDADPQLLAREREIQSQLAALEEQRLVLLQANGNAGELAERDRQTEVLLQQYRELQEEIRRNSPEYAALRYPQPLTLAQIQQQVLDEDTVLLQYFLGDRHSYLWAVTTDEIVAYQLPPRAEIEAAVKKLRNTLTHRLKRRLPQEVRKDAEALSQAIFAPVADRLQGKRLLFVGDGALQYAPIAALPLPEREAYEPLILEHEIVSLPSVSTLAVLRQSDLSAEGRGSTASKAIAIFADPVFGGNDDDRLEKPIGNVATASLRSSARDIGLAMPPARLLGTRQEAEEILAIAAGEENRLALGFDANREAATSEDLKQYRIIHFATHGFVNSVNPSLSGLVLSLADATGRAPQRLLAPARYFQSRPRCRLGRPVCLQNGLGRRGARRRHRGFDPRLHVCRNATPFGQFVGRGRCGNGKTHGRLLPATLAGGAIAGRSLAASPIANVAARRMAIALLLGWF